jgi:hypothetical protein
MLGLVPEVRTHTSGPGDTFETVLWRVFALPELTAQRLPRRTERRRRRGRTVGGVDGRHHGAHQARRRPVAPELAGALQALRKPDNSTDLPPGYDARARRLSARAQRARSGGSRSPS